ncbi:MAG: EAL domain-containing protein, partial [Planctomycetota bacterium]
GARLSGASASLRRRREAVVSARLAQSQLSLRAVPIGIATIVDLTDDQRYAYLAVNRSLDDGRQIDGGSFLGPNSRARSRRMQARRQSAMEACAQNADCSIFVAPAASWETSEAETLRWHFETLRATLPGEIALFASVDANDAVDQLSVGQFCRDLHHAGVELALDAFVGSGTHIHDLKELQPQLLLLAPELTAQIERTPRRERQILQLVQACEDEGITPVVQGCRDRASCEHLLGAGLSKFAMPSPFEALPLEPNSDELTLAAS